MSLHRCDDMTFFPERTDGLPMYTGSGAGTGFNVNVAWHTQYKSLGCTRNKSLGCNEYKHACEEVLLPIAREFKPDLILVSCGFDSAIHD